MDPYVYLWASMKPSGWVQSFKRRHNISKGFWSGYCPAEHGQNSFASTKKILVSDSSVSAECLPVIGSDNISQLTNGAYFCYVLLYGLSSFHHIWPSASPDWSCRKVHCIQGARRRRWYGGTNPSSTSLFIGLPSQLWMWGIFLLMKLFYSSLSPVHTFPVCYSTPISTELASPSSMFFHNICMRNEDSERDSNADRDTAYLDSHHSYFPVSYIRGN